MIITILILLGFVAIGAIITAILYEDRLLLWRVRWIELEHESAAKDGREPRDINTAFLTPNAKLSGTETEPTTKRDA